MKPLQVLSLIFAIILLLPGLCFFGFGAAFLVGPGGHDEFNLTAMGPVLLVIGIVVLGVTGLLGYYAFRRKPPVVEPPAQDGGG
jgi:hypothetical protein